MAMLCDLLGPSQHIGECSFDSIQYILFNADGIKEKLRPRFDKLSDEELADLVEHSTPANTFRSRAAIVKGLLAIRDRFKAHFEFLDEPEAKEKCAGDPRAIRDFYESLLPAHPKRRLSMVKSIEAAHALQNKNSYPNNVKYEPGNTRMHSRVLLDYIFELFNIPYRTLEPVSADLPFLTVGIFLHTFIIEKNKDGVYALRMENGNPGQHAVGIVKCNGQWFLYDDNSGVYPMSMPMVTFIVNYLHDPQEEYKVAIKTFGENTFMLYKLIRDGEPDYTTVDKVWSSKGDGFKVPKRGKFILDIDEVYPIVHYFVIRSTLYDDIAADNVEAVQQSFSAGIDINIQDAEGNTPLFEASAKGSLEVLRYLLDKGANPEIANHAGHTPLMAAAYHNQMGSVKLLVERGAMITEDVMSFADPIINETRPDKSTDLRDYLLIKRKPLLEGAARTRKNKKKRRLSFKRSKHSAL
jgi:hypothetical protein